MNISDKLLVTISLTVIALAVIFAPGWSAVQGKEVVVPIVTGMTGFVTGAVWASKAAQDKDVTTSGSNGPGDGDAR